MSRHLIAAGLLFAAAAMAEPQWGSPQRSGNHVTYAAEAQTIPARRSAALQVRFHVDDGFHVNSHTPNSELLIPTVLTLGAVEGVTAQAPSYPAGTPYSFSFDPKEKLDVYQGDFTVTVPVVASAGEHTLNATLRYQACDKAACYPPRTVPVQVLFAAK